MFLFQKALKKAKVQLAEKIIACDYGSKDVEHKDEADKFNGGKNVLMVRFPKSMLGLIY